ncbi:MAG: glutathione S-transferase family protein [Alphaproteobacteria bacterium]
MIRICNFANGARGLRVIWQCEEMGLPYEVETISFPPQDAYRRRNRLGTVPFLEDDDVAITESVAMMLYLAQAYGPTPLLPARDPVRMAKVMELTVFAEATFGAGLSTLMAAHFAAPAEHKDNWSVRAQVRRTDQALHFIEASLGEYPFLTGIDLTLADMAIATGLGMWKGALGRDIPERLATWRYRLTARPTYQRALEANS